MQHWTNHNVVLTPDAGLAVASGYVIPSEIAELMEQLGVSQRAQEMPTANQEDQDSPGGSLQGSTAQGPKRAASTGGGKSSKAFQTHS